MSKKKRQDVVCAFWLFSMSVVGSTGEDCVTHYTVHSVHVVQTDGHTKLTQWAYTVHTSGVIHTSICQTDPTTLAFSLRYSYSMVHSIQYTVYSIQYTALEVSAENQPGTAPSLEKRSQHSADCVQLILGTAVSVLCTSL